MHQEWLLLLVMLSLLVVVSVLAVGYNLRLVGKITKQFRMLGGRFDLEITEAPRTMGGLYQRNPTLWGHHKGREMSITTKGRGLDNTRQTGTEIRMMTQAPVGLRFTLVRRQSTAKLGQVGRLESCETGDRAFDQRFSLKSNHPAAARSLFGPEMRGKVIQLWEADSGFLELKERALAYEELGLPCKDAQGAHLAAMAEFLLELAGDLDTLTAG